MKKIALSFLFIFAIFANIEAQEDDFSFDFEDDEETASTTSSSSSSSSVVNKKGESVLPVAGDIAIGIDAEPLANFIGNMFNGTMGQSYDGLFLSEPTTLFIKYFLTDESAIRVKFQVELNSTNDDYYVTDDVKLLADPASTAFVTDNRHTLTSDYGLGVGYEMHRGKGRLKGVFGGELLFGMSSSKRTYEYGNAFSATNLTPTTSDFAGASNNPTTRALETNDLGDNHLSFGLGAFIGVEYFFMPNISLGTNLSWGTNFENTFESEATVESWNGTAAEKTNVKVSPKSANFSLGMNNPEVKLYLMFHF